MAKQLLEYSAYVNNLIDIHVYSEKAFRKACRFGHLEIAKWLVDYATSIGSPINIHAEAVYMLYCKTTAFTSACESGHLEVVKWLTHYAESIGSPVDEEILLLSFDLACYDGHVKVSKWIVNNFSVNINVWSCYAFFYACTHGHLEMAIWLTEYAASTGKTIEDESVQKDILRWHSGYWIMLRPLDTSLTYMNRVICVENPMPLFKGLVLKVILKL